MAGLQAPAVSLVMWASHLFLSSSMEYGGTSGSGPVVRTVRLFIMQENGTSQRHVSVPSSVRGRRPTLSVNSHSLSHPQHPPAHSCNSLPLPPAYVPCPCPLSSSCSLPVPVPGHPVFALPFLAIQFVSSSTAVSHIYSPSANLLFPIPSLPFPTPTHLALFPHHHHSLLHYAIPSTSSHPLPCLVPHQSPRPVITQANLSRRRFTRVFTRSVTSQHSNHRHRASTIIRQRPALVTRLEVVCNYALCCCLSTCPPLSRQPALTKIPGRLLYRNTSLRQ